MSTVGVNDLGGQEEWGLQGRKQRGDQTCLKDKVWDGQGGAQGSDTSRADSHSLPTVTAGCPAGLGAS